MKIVFIGEAISGFGGMETVIRNVIQTLSAEPFSAQCKIFFTCRKNDMDKKWLKDIDAHYSISNIKLSPLRRAKHLHALSSWLSDEQPDVVIAIDPLSCLYASRARLKTNGYFTLFSWPHFSLDHKKHAKYITCADEHLAISCGIRQQMIKRGVAEKNIHVIYNPTDKTPVVIPAHSQNDIPAFIYVGRLKFEGQKRVKDLLDSFSRVPGRWKLHIIGDGSDSDRCKTYAQELCIANRITWHGWQAQPWKVVQQEIGQVTALLLTSSFEGFPMTLLEAMARGIPCISSDCISGPGDIIIPGVNGCLYPPGERAELSALISAMINGEITFDHAAIPATIDAFYADNYYRRLGDILYSRSLTPSLSFQESKKKRTPLTTALN
ncbi:MULTISPECIES: lipopolysaccharide 1,6-galactosyltransferase [unclassified Pseudocitrobacter]|uniref:lipopolysaccharide 1,6-galactosyltransferase n=1 Tax=unclassified Pseudocitrobacter TaxID=2638778 RepID=UPI0023E3DE06|nr:MULTISPECIES: lipopolysaccharide 1,6-galactosyltransferase [unclassified Pseudocitrobacter]MDF3826488.1 lipopolysaccharide 1,6-galactosyltransferase [Pseudocitrobacter sp. 2023EL-00150]MEC5372307.1 lipopolysaccharide 1,6-galactosyltransferase [Pseudocitrobacter sp. MW920760]